MVHIQNFLQCSILGVQLLDHLTSYLPFEKLKADLEAFIPSLCTKDLTSDDDDDDDYVWPPTLGLSAFCGNGGGLQGKMSLSICFIHKCTPTVQTTITSSPLLHVMFFLVYASHVSIR